MPDDLISRSALIKTFEDARLGENSFVETVLAAGVYATIENAPPVEAVEVVRCKECKNYRDRESKLGIHWCDKWGNLVRDMDFCSFGERKMDLQEVEADG